MKLDALVLDALNPVFLNFNLEMARTQSTENTFLHIRSKDKNEYIMTIAYVDGERKEFYNWQRDDDYFSYDLIQQGSWRFATSGRPNEECLNIIKTILGNEYTEEKEC